MSSIATTPRGYIERPRPSGLADVIDVILDKGLVIDAYVRVSLIGIEILTIDARIVVASVDTYLRFAEAVNRLDIAHDDTTHGLPDLMESITESGSSGKTKGMLEGAKESLFGGDDDDDDDKQNGQSRSKSRSRATSRSGSSSSRSSRSRSSGGSSSGSSRSRKKSS